VNLPLNDAQRLAVEHRGGPLLVLAGAGSGKTRVLTARLAHLAAHDVAASRILAVTFTNKAAEEMRRRVAILLGREPDGLWIGTFHSIAARLLRREAPLIGFTSAFTIYDEDDRLDLVKRILEQHGRSPKAFPPRLITALISAAKNRLTTPAEMAANAGDPQVQVAAETYGALTEALSAANAMDFDDLLLHPLAVFREHPHRLQHYQQRFASVLVDEFQDTNRAQYLFVRHLAQEHHNICAVGDDDQSIYAWRGAHVRNMLDFQADFPDTTIVRLEQNYRSTRRILEAANRVIAQNRARLGKTLYTVRQGGERLTIVAAADERDEAEWVARELRARAGEDQYAWRDMAVLYRTNSQSRVFEDAFRRVAIPHRVVGTVSFYERREVRDLLAYLRLIVNPADAEAFRRAVQVPRRGIGMSSLALLEAAAATWKKPLLLTAAMAQRIADLRPLVRDKLREFAGLVESLRSQAPGTPPASLIEQLIDTIAYDAFLSEAGPEGVERMENVRELVAAAAAWAEEAVEPEDGATPLERFLTSAALATSEDSVGGDPEGVSLLTVHAAKGLEWPVVVLAGLEDGLFPLSRSLETQEGIEEERRLAYVGITRARDRLYLSWARTRRRGGQVMPGRRSRFLDALPADVDERRTSGMFGGELSRHPGFAWTASRTEPEQASQDAPRFVKGERVRHKSFGSGTILGLAGAGRDLKVVVSFDDSDVGTKQLLVSLANLEREWDAA
jgi:DNA helicase-2/ATP-dependent DNA helicase PcrA